MHELALLCECLLGKHVVFYLFIFSFVWQILAVKKKAWIYPSPSLYFSSTYLSLRRTWKCPAFSPHKLLRIKTNLGKCHLDFTFNFSSSILYPSDRGFRKSEYKGKRNVKLRGRVLAIGVVELSWERSPAQPPPHCPMVLLIQTFLPRVKLCLTSTLPLPRGRSSLEHPGLLVFPLSLCLLFPLQSTPSRTYYGMHLFVRMGLKEKQVKQHNQTGGNGAAACRKEEKRSN